MSAGRHCRVLSVAGLVTGALLACSGPAPDPSVAPEASAPGRPTSGSAAPSTDSGDSAGPASIKLAFGGDVHFERQVAATLQDSARTWAARLPELAAADFAMVNLETAITTRGTPEPKTYTFRAPAKALQVLKQAGVDAVSSANNHAADFGDVGIADTLAAKASGTLPMLGFGADVTEAFAPLSVDIKGVNTAVLASTQIMDRTATVHAATDTRPGVATNGDLTRLVAATRAAAADHDLVVVYLHWGTEGSTCPNPRQHEAVTALEAAGADIVVGTHAHRPQGMGWKGRTFVGYGLGNYVWYNTSATSRPSGVLTVTVDAAAARRRGQDRRSTADSLVNDYTWTPKYISSGGVPQVPTAGTAPHLKNLHEAAQQCAGLNDRVRN